MARWGNIFNLGSVRCEIVEGPDVAIVSGTNSGLFATVARAGAGIYRFTLRPDTRLPLDLAFVNPDRELYVAEAISFGAGAEAHAGTFTGGPVLQIQAVTSLNGVLADLPFALMVYRSGYG